MKYTRKSNARKSNARKSNARKSNARKRMGGRLGISYYATPVSGMKVAEPTYWIGGRKRTKKRIKKK
jgi:hypothetical protein